MTDLPRRFEAELVRLGIASRRVIVAVSGGPDSLALLELTALVRPALGLLPVVAHFDHGIHPASGAVADAVAGHAARHAFPSVAGAGHLGPDATETEARDVRHRWLEARADEFAAPILTAHHRDDQVETLLMRFLEGSGPLGLSGMAATRGPWVRPLLGVSRAELAAFLADRRVAPAWVDPSNVDPRHLRGWIRGTLLPVIAARMPRAADSIHTSRRMFADHRAAWYEVMDALPGLDVRREGDGASVAADGLAGYSSAVVRSVLQALGRRVGIGLGRGALDRVQLLLSQGHTGQSVDLGRGAVAELGFGRLRLFGSAAHPVPYDVVIDGPGSFRAGGWQLDVVPDEGPGGLERVSSRTWIPAGTTARVRNWRSGDRIRPIGGRGSRLVVRCMQDQKISRHLRPSWPVVEIDGEVIWVPGVCRAGSAVPVPGTRAMRVDAKSG